MVDKKLENKTATELAMEQADKAAEALRKKRR